MGGTVGSVTSDARRGGRFCRNRIRSEKPLLAHRAVRGERQSVERPRTQVPHGVTEQPPAVRPHSPLSPYPFFAEVVNEPDETAKFPRAS